MKSTLGKGLFVLMLLGFMGAAMPASAEASERVVVRTERHWVQPRVGVGYWSEVPVYSNDYYTTPSYTYSYPDYYSSYSYPSYGYSSYPYYGGYYGGYYGPSVGLGFNFGFGGGGRGGGHWGGSHRR